MPTLLTDVEARILGSLIEKSLTTPDLYPLSLNSLVNACNQKSSREPVMTLDEGTIARSLATLRDKTLVYQKSESGNRTPKFGHRVENLINGGTAKEVGAICVLLLRGPQTPGEIKTRTDRLCEFESVAEVVTVLDDLANRPDGPFVSRMPRQSGQKETRYTHLFFGDAPAPAMDAAPPKPVVARSAAVTEPSLVDRVAALERRVAELESRLNPSSPENTNG